MLRWCYLNTEKVLYYFIREFLKIRPNLQRHKRFYILSSKHTYRPMSARIVAQLFYKDASIIVSYASTELYFRNSGLPKMFDTVRFFRGYRRCFICRISRIPKGCLLREYSIFSNYSDFRRSPKMIVLFVEFPNTDFSNDIWCRISQDMLSMHWQWPSRSRRSGVQQCSIFPEVSHSTEDALFVELGGFLKIINSFDTANLLNSSDGGRCSTTFHVFQRLSKMSIRSFPKVSKDRTGR